MIGRRINLQPGQDPIILNESEYAEHPEAKGLWFFRVPGKKELGCVYDKNVTGNEAHHSVTEHEDGTITISPSILISDNAGPLWHGFLERGVWREC